MFSNYLKIAWRSLLRNKTFSLINIMGLALGLTCSLLIYCWIQDELGMDGFHKNGDRLYQVYERRTYNGQVDAGYLTQGLLAGELKRLIPEIQYASSLEQCNRYLFEAGERHFKMEGSYAGADFFRMFSFPLLQGNPETALGTPSGIAISRKMAEQFFGSPAQAVGKSIRFDHKTDLQVTAVFENTPASSSLQFDFLRPWIDYEREQRWVSNWGSASPAAYVQLRPGASAVATEAKIRDFLYHYLPRNPDERLELGLQPFPEKYLHASFQNGQVDGGRIAYVRLFGIVAAFILLIACINFMNLATARATQRAKEVGVRKVVGAPRTMLAAQFTGEALLLALGATIIAVLLSVLLMPVFNNLTGRQLSLPWTQPLFWAALPALCLVTGLLAGSYPALFLSSLHPVKVLKGPLKFSRGAAAFRKGLVVFQFALSIALIVGMIVIYRQVNYIRHKNLGYDRENLIYIPLEGQLSAKYDLFKAEALQTKGILAVSSMRESPTVIGHQKSDIGWAGKDPAQPVTFTDAAVGYDFVKTMRLQLKEGRDFSGAYGSDSTGFILNEAALKLTGYSNPIGQPFWWGNNRGTIIGVLKDFHFNSMHQAIEPLFIRLDLARPWGNILVRTEAGKTQAAIAGLEKLCKALNPGVPFTYQFSDQEYAKLYRNEQLVSSLANCFALLAIFISCLGLFGLAMFTTAQRTREIGVRKVLGASLSNILALLAAGFLQPVAIAMLIAFPVAWYAMDRWLQGFAYSAGLEWWMFALAALLAVVIALATVSYQSIKAALVNPVNSLKAE